VNEPLLNKVDSTENSEYIQGLQKKLTPAYSRWQKDNLYKELITSLHDRESLYTNLQVEYTSQIKTLLDLHEKKLKIWKTIASNFVRPSQRNLTVLKHTRNKSLGDELDELLDSATPDVKKEY
jgi:hypothetical protein